MKHRVLSLFLILLTLCLILCGCQTNARTDVQSDFEDDLSPTPSYDSLENVPRYSGSPYVVINDNIPDFTEEQKTSTDAYEFYSALDALGRCGVAHACIGTELMPTEDRGDIGSVKPSGWEQKKYDSSLVDGGYIYNRCHLIGFQLTGENANKKNLITGTRYMNVEGMLPFENMVDDYIEETGNHVMYRVTPIFEGQNLLASGVQIEAYSIEDGGEGICFNVYVYNVQPGITIDYFTGENWLDEDGSSSGNSSEDDEEQTYILNTNTKRIHRETCSSVASISEKNKEVYHGTKQALLDQNYSPCGTCKP